MSTFLVYVQFGVAASRSSGDMSTSVNIANVALCYGEATVETKPEDLPGAVESITLNNTKVNMTAGETRNIMAIVTPMNAKDVGIAWNSSNPSVATVNDIGQITAVADGEAIITATTNDGNKTESCVVTVGESIELTEISIMSNTLQKNNNTISGGVSVGISNVDTTQNSDIVFAVYDDMDRLVYISLKKNITLNKNDNIIDFNNINISDVSGSNYRCKVFVWNSIDGMIPLYDSYTNSNILN